MFIRTTAVLLALVAIAGAQVPAPPKPKIISMPKVEAPSKPKTKPKGPAKPKTKIAEDPAETPTLPAAESVKAPPAESAENTPAISQPPAPRAPEAPKRSRAVEAALGAYMPKVKASLGKGWAVALREKAADFQPGNVSVTFKVDAEGKVASIATTENSSNAAFGKFCEDYVRGIQFEPPPSRALEEGTLEIPFTFWLY